MKRLEVIILAGIFWIPAILLVCAGVSSGQPSTATLASISTAPWAESRHYDDIAEAQRFSVIAEDTVFDAWVAEKARAEGVELAQQEKQLVSGREKQLEFAAVRNGLISRMKVTDEEVEKLACERGWTKPLPARWEVLYIFIDTTATGTEAEKETLHKRALWLGEQLTADSFKEFARLWSDAPSSADGGRLGALTLEGLGPTFVSQIKKTPVGKIGGPYRTRSGWNIFYVRSYTPPTERKFSQEKLHEMTARVKADEQARQAKKSPELWETLISRFGVTSDTVIREELGALENFLLARRYINNKAPESTPSEEDLREIYEEKADVFVFPPCRKALEILVTADDWTLDRSKEGWLKRRAVRNRARELRERILKGEDFAEIARKYSASSTATKGGDLGWIQEPSSALIDTSLAPLKAGEVSPPVATGKGYLLLQLVDVRLKKPMSFEEACRKCEDIWRSRQHRQVEEKLREEFTRLSCAKKGL